MRRELWPLFVAPLLRRPGRMLLSLLAIALGVALGLAVALIHRSALDELARGVREFGGDADLQVSAGREGFPETLYPALARAPEVLWAAPLVIAEVRVAGQANRLRLLGVDTLRLAGGAFAAVGEGGGRGGGEAAGAGPGAGFGLLEPDTVALSPAAAAGIGVRPGERLTVLAGSAPVELRVVALLPETGGTEWLAVADIATAQWRFGAPGRLSRLDLRLRGGAGGLAAAQAALAARLPPGVSIAPPGREVRTVDRLSRAYRTNLAMLALMALLTGGFLVFAVQSATVIRRRSELAFLRTLGMTRREILGGLLAEALTVGLLGSLLGVALGHGLAYLLLEQVGGDLGAGYFRGVRPPLSLAPQLVGLHAVLGVAASLAGAWLPASEAVAAAPAQALRAGDAQRLAVTVDRLWPAVACLATGGLALLLPPLAELPVGGYLAIALWLAGAVLLLPRLARLLWQRLPLPRPPALALALAQLRGSAGLTAIGAAGVLAATAVAAAMAIMVGSFRGSVDQWLTAVLPADLYLSFGSSREAAHFDAATQARIVATAGVGRVDFVRYVTVPLDAERPAITVIARPLHGRPPPSAVGRTHPAPPGTTAVWASEAMADLYGWYPGTRVRLPFAGGEQLVHVAGLWRDYARSHGAVLLEREDYLRLTGDGRANDAALFLQPAADADTVAGRLRRQLAGGEWLTVTRSSEVRQRTLAIFDRTFAVTWLLEAAAVVIGLAGVAASFAAQAAGRLREFGMLVHLGCDRRLLLTMIGSEAAAVAGLGVAVGLFLALAIAGVLITVVNRQSFHWSMDLALPGTALAALGLAMIACAVAAALLASRPALGARAVRAVREDW